MSSELDYKGIMDSEPEPDEFTKCYFCEKPATGRIRVIEDPDGEHGVPVPVCEEHLQLKDTN